MDDVSFTAIITYYDDVTDLKAKVFIIYEAGVSKNHYLNSLFI